MLYAIYSFPNIIIPLLGGVLIDKIGARVVFIITCAFCVLGQFICSFGAFQGYFWLMLMGRAVFGIGGEVLQGSQSTIISNWFRPEELSVTEYLFSLSWVFVLLFQKWEAH
jgi:MFS family permease